MQLPQMERRQDYVPGRICKDSGIGTLTTKCMPIYVSDSVQRIQTKGLMRLSIGLALLIFCFCFHHARTYVLSTHGLKDQVVVWTNTISNNVFLIEGFLPH